MMEDQEATAALLMLNTDRRSWAERGGGNGGERKTGEGRSVETGKSSGRGMSVKDLLSS
jgi:hypothetical protein